MQNNFFIFLLMILMGALNCNFFKKSSTTKTENVDESPKQFFAQKHQQYLKQTKKTFSEYEKLYPWFETLKKKNHGLIHLPLFDELGNDQGTMVLTNLSQRILHEHIPSIKETNSIRKKDPFESATKTFAALKKSLADRNINFLLMPIPPKTAIYPEMIDKKFRIYSKPIFLDLSLRQWYADLSNNQVEVIDLLPSFLDQRFRSSKPNKQKNSDLPNTIYLRKDSHWSPYGSAIAAKILGERIKHYPWHKKFLEENGEPVLEITREQIRLSNETYWMDRVRIKGEKKGDFISDPNSPIMLIGDSYSFTRYGLAENILKETKIRVDLVHSAGASAMFSIIRNNPRIAQKKLLIFEFFPAVNFLHWTPELLEGAAFTKANLAEK